MGEPLLRIVGLKTQFSTDHALIRAVDGVSFSIDQGQVLGIVGESGSGKSVTALSIMRLIEPPGEITEGQVLFRPNGTNVDLLKLPQAKLEHVRGNQIGMIFQDPMTSLNPVLTIGYQLTESLRKHRGMSVNAANTRAVELLDRVGIPEPQRRLKDYPHQLSGGMRQRVMIAMAVACRPQLLIADEPTTALDVTIQAQIIDLLQELKRDLGTAIIIITHDLGVVAHMADEVAVMYAGNIVEHGSIDTIFDDPQHPYTRALLLSVPRLHAWPERLTTIEGSPPNLGLELAGCPFEPRCPDRIERCASEHPPLLELAPRHRCACWVAQQRKAHHV